MDGILVVIAGSHGSFSPRAPHFAKKTDPIRLPRVPAPGRLTGVMIMANAQMTAQMSKKGGFIAALDQSGGSSPGALRLYGIPDSAYSGDAEMFKLIHQMRVRIMAAPAFTGAKVIAAILFEATMDGQAQEMPVPAFLWEERGVIPFLKVDKG